MKERIAAMRLVLPEAEAFYRESTWSNSVTKWNGCEWEEMRKEVRGE